LIVDFGGNRGGAGAWIPPGVLAWPFGNAADRTGNPYKTV